MSRLPLRAILIPLLALLAAVALVGAFAMLIGPASWAMAGDTVRRLGGKERADAINAVRVTLLAAVGGAAGLISAGFAGRTYFLARRTQVTDRYGKAVALLASERPGEHIGGVFALEHVMRESAKDHEAVVEVLAAFVRAHRKDTPAGGGDEEIPQRGPELEIVAAMTVLARRPRRPEHHRIDLRQARLAGLELPPHARLERADLTGADLRCAKLIAADLHGALLDDARLSRATLDKARLDEASLRRAELDCSHLAGCRLRKAVLIRANLTKANLNDADLEDAWLDEAKLPHAQLHRAVLKRTSLIHTDISQCQLLTATQLLEADVRNSTTIAQSILTTPLSDWIVVCDTKQARIPPPAP